MLIKFNYFYSKIISSIKWGLGIGDLGIWDWAQSPLKKLKINNLMSLKKKLNEKCFPSF